MIYPRDFEVKLGFDQIRERLINFCISSLGRRDVGTISFGSDFAVIERLQRQNWELKSIKEKGEPLPLTHFEDPTSHFATIAIEGAFVEGETFLIISNSLLVAFGCIDFLSKSKEIYPYLHQLCATINLPRNILREINIRINDVGQVKDSASPELAAIRKKLQNETQRARKLVDHLFKEAVAGGLVPEGSSPVIRQGRVVIPVLAEHKRRLQGVIMDESATGHTVFIEPTDVLEANNEIRNLELAERREIIKILKDLTSLLRMHLTELNQIYNFLANLDLIHAKAKLAMELKCEYPVFVDRPVLAWNQARHPLLFLSHKDKKTIVPLSIDLSETDRFLLVSGPNAGGKSVCLKTVGLLQYMWQCGLLVPLLESSTVGLFKDVFLDIGDQQSIENDLSTYSSHLRNMRFFVEKATGDTLVLMDELGAGTDPNFGGGIAEAILKALVQKKVWGVATTHYYNLKLFAEHQSGIRNAAMLFDSKKLEPQFMLEIGKPGSSFALEIARKIGLPKMIMDQAEQNIGKELTGLENLIKKVNDESQQVAKRERELRVKEVRYSELLNKYNQLSNELESKQKLILNKAKQEAAMLLKQTNKEIEKTIRHIKENRAEKKETRKIRQSLEGLSRQITTPEKEPIKSSATPIGEEDYVKIDGQDVVGRVISVKGQSAIVQFGDMRSTIKINKLVKSNARESKAQRATKTMGVDYVSKQSNFSPTLDVRGKRAEEIISVIDQFLDDAVLLSHHELRILHGKGEGVLRQLIRDHLKRHRDVVSFGDEHVERGGAGITQVILK